MCHPQDLPEDVRQNLSHDLLQFAETQNLRAELHVPEATTASARRGWAVLDAMWDAGNGDGFISFLSRPISTNDKIFEVRSRYSYCIWNLDVCLINFTWHTFEQIAQYWLVGSLILCFWSLQVDALWNARRRWSCTGRSAKHHEAMRLASIFLLYQLNCGWVELWKPHSRNFMKFYIEISCWNKKDGCILVMRSSPPENPSFKCSRWKVTPCW